MVRTDGTGCVYYMSRLRDARRLRDGVVGLICVVYRQRSDDRRSSSGTIARHDSSRANSQLEMLAILQLEVLVLIPGRIVVHLEPERLDRGVVNGAHVFAR